MCVIAAFLNTISADNIHVLSQGLFTVVNEYFKYGGEAIFIDEVHKYPNWSIELKNIIDTYRDKKIVFSASSVTDLKHSKADLSRRVIYYELLGLSFREYLQFAGVVAVPRVSFQDIVEQHTDIARQFSGKTILKHFRDYLHYGYFPFFLEGTLDYLTRVNNVIEKVVFEDIATSYNLKQPTLYTLKKLLWLVATSASFSPNFEKISKNLQVPRSTVYNCFEYLDHACLTTSVYADARGMKLVRKPAKVFLHNTSLLYAINGDLKLNSATGDVRETFFVSQVAGPHRVNAHQPADFLVDGEWVVEVGGAKKTDKQIRQEKNALLAIDNIEIGVGEKVPLYLFGLLY